MAPADVAELVARIPALDRQGKFDGPTWENAAKICDALLAGGEAALSSLFGMIADVDDGKDYKARTIVHVLAVYVCRPGKEEARALVSRALAAALGGALPKGARGFFARQLQVCGLKEAGPALGKLLLDPELHEFAAQALTAIGAVEPLREALPRASGRPLATIVQALGVLRDAPSAAGLRRAAADPEARLTALWALAAMGDASCAPLLLAALESEHGMARVQIVDAIHTLADKLGPPEGTRLRERLQP
jgi:hypothetical protein